MSILVNTKNLSYDEWLRWRQRGIGGSDAAAVCGLSPYRSPIDVWLDKTGRTGPKPDNEAMRIGRDLEDYVAHRFMEATGFRVRRDNHMYTADEQPFMLANVDRVIIGQDALLECKTVTPYKSGLWEDGACPEEYELQCHHYMAVTGASRVYLAALIFGNDFKIVEIPRDEEVIRQLSQIEADFWNHYVLAGEMPLPDGSKSATQAIRAVFPNSVEETKDLSYMVDTLARLDEVVGLQEQLEKEENELKQRIQLEMKEADTAYIGDRKITWKTRKPRVTVDSARLKKELPEVYEKYSKVGDASRTFRIW